MSRSFVRGLRSTARTLIQYIGNVGTEDILTTNGGAGPTWEAATTSIVNAIETAEPRIKKAMIQGAKAHLSSKDRGDKQMVITVGLHTASDTRVGSLHIHLDGTFFFFPSRQGREGGYERTLLQARIAGHLPTRTEQPNQSA